MRILVADDDVISRRVLEATLERWGYELEVASDGQQAWETISRRGGPRLAVLDRMMSGLDGLTLCRRLRARPAEDYVYVIVVSARDSADEQLEALAAGADDFVSKPFEPGELRARLRSALRILALQNELLMTREALRDRATFDGLTSIYSRSAVLEFLNRELSRCYREESPLSLILCDVDHFKQVNRTFKSQAADEILIELAARLQLGIRRYDFLGRHGGGTFLVGLPSCEEGDALALAERLRHAVNAAPVETSQGPIDVSMSFGLRSLPLTQNEAPPSMDLALSEAARALAQAKDEGRDCVRVFGREGSF